MKAKAKRIGNDEWIEGYYQYDWDTGEHWINYQVIEPTGSLVKGDWAADYIDLATLTFPALEEAKEGFKSLQVIFERVSTEQKKENTELKEFIRQVNENYYLPSEVHEKMKALTQEK